MSGGRLAVLDGAQHRVFILTAFRRGFTPVKNPRFRGQPGMRKTMPAFNTIVLDEGGNVWVDVVQDGDAKGRVYDVFSPEGIYLKQVAMAYRVSSFRRESPAASTGPRTASPRSSASRWSLSRREGEGGTGGCSRLSGRLGGFFGAAGLESAGPPMRRDGPAPPGGM